MLLPPLKGQKTPLLVIFIISLMCIDYGKPRVVVQHIDDITQMTFKHISA